MCRPRDLVAQPLVVGGVVKEGNGHWRLGGRELCGSKKKNKGEALCTGSACNRSLSVRIFSLQSAVKQSQSITRCAVPQEFSVRFTGGWRLRLIVNVVARRSVRSTTRGIHCAPAEHGLAYNGRFSRTTTRKILCKCGRC